MKHEKGSFTTVSNMSAIKGKNPILQTIYMWLCFHADKKGMCFPSQSTIANSCGASIASVNRHVRELEKIGLIKRETRNIKGSKEKDTTIYKLGTLTETVPTLTETVQVLSQREGGTLTVRERTKPIELNSIIEDESSVEKKIIQPHIKIINMYLTMKDLKVNEEQYKAEIKRNVKVSAKLNKMYTERDIAATMIYCAENFNLWKLEAVDKNILEVKNKKVKFKKKTPLENRVNKLIENTNNFKTK